VRKWADLEGAIHDLVRDQQSYKTVVIDSVDWAERMLVDQVKGNKRSIEDIPFGKGYVMVAEAMGRILSLLDQLIALGVNVVLVGHTTVKRCNPPDLDEGYDRFELKLTKQSGPLVKEWADCILFANYRTKLVEGTDGRTRAKGGTERVLHAERTAAWDAKNRYGLPAELPMTIEALAPLLHAVPAARKPATWRERIASATSTEDLGALGDQVNEAESASKLTAEQADQLRGLIDGRHRELEPEEVTS